MWLQSTYQAKRTVYYTAIWPAILYGSECWALKGWEKVGITKINVKKDVWSNNKGQNTKWCYRGEIDVALIEEKTTENRLRWLWQVQKRSLEGPMRRAVCMG